MPKKKVNTEEIGKQMCEKIREAIMIYKKAYKKAGYINIDVRILSNVIIINNEYWEGGPDEKFPLYTIEKIDESI